MGAVPAGLQCVLVRGFRFIEGFFVAGEITDSSVDRLWKVFDDGRWVVGFGVDVERFIVWFPVGVECFVR